MRATLSIVVACAVILAIGPAPSTLTRAAAARKGKLTVEKVEYKGWKNNLKLSNGDAELIVTLDVGPRVISYRLADGKNVFREYDGQLGKSGESTWMIRGGHRLWASPEDPARTYVPDNGPVAFAEIGPGAVRLTPAPEASVGLQKEMDVKLEPGGSRVTVVHRIRNVGKAPTDLAPWALSVMKGGGVEVIPLPPKRPHPGDAKHATAADFGPDFRLALWSYTDFQDSRFHFGSKAITLRQDPTKGATKIGLSHKMGYVGYLNGGTLFVKRFDYQDGKHYPDLGVNYETYSNQDMVEMESLGPLTRLAPGEAAEHTEHWELVPNVEDFKDEAELDARILSRFRAR
ncbi:MAG TPA: hypothetical protein VG406_29055 [Isosphaeraceae bacterium]|nr:hypothetical protein [Isosphaeraceae bacterium]